MLNAPCLLFQMFRKNIQRSVNWGKPFNYLIYKYILLLHTQFIPLLFFNRFCESLPTQHLELGVLCIMSWVERVIHMIKQQYFEPYIKYCAISGINLIICLVYYGNYSTLMRHSAIEVPFPCR